MGIFGRVMLGYALTKLTNVHEELLVSRSKSFIGAGGGVDSLPVHRQREISEKYPKWLDQLKVYPQYDVTRALLKNLQVSDAVRNELRSLAINELFGVLVMQGCALDVEAYTAFHPR